ncbi:type IV secretory system conjugative DNA transfer family protein [Glaciimonas sp. GG7]
MLCGVCYVFMLARKKAGMDDLHGSAHWASVKEVDATGFYPTNERQVDGAIIGSVMVDSKNAIIHPMHPKYHRRYRSVMEGPIFQRRQQRDKDGVPKVALSTIVKQVKLLRDDNPAHILAFAPTRSGKGVGLILPTLYTWRHSVLINDIKNENWALTSGFRQAAGQTVIRFEPACLDGSAARWNPLDEIRIFTDMDVQDAQSIMNMVCDPKGEGLEDHWAKTSWEFLTGLALHLRYEGKTATMAGMAQYLGDPRWEDEKQMYTTMLQTQHDPEGKTHWLDTDNNRTSIHPAVANAAKTMLNKEDKERTSVLSTAKSFLSLYLDPVVARNTATSDFLVRDLMNSDKPVSCYYVVQPADLERMTSLSRLFYAMVIRRNAADMQFAGGAPVQSYKHRLLLVIDELPSLRKLTVLQEALGYMAGYGMKCYLICQDIIQLEDAYGDKQTIVAGCHVRISYAPNTSETAEKLAAMTGKTTITEEKRSTSFKQMGVDTGNVSVSEDKTGRELMTSAEFLALSREDMVIFVAGSAPIYGRKIKYYEDKAMNARSKIPAPAKSDILRSAVVVVTPVSNPLIDREMQNRQLWQKQVASATTEGVVTADADCGALNVKGSADVTDDGIVAMPMKKQSFYAGRVHHLSDTEKEEIIAMAHKIGTIESVALLSVF